MSWFDCLRFLAGLWNNNSGLSGTLPPARRRGRKLAAPRAALRDLLIAETLESRLLLSATATTNFILASPNSSGAKPDASAGVAPIDPAQMRAAYGVSSITFGSTAGTGAGETIAIVDAYNDPDIISDANSFSSEFGLPEFNGSGEPTLTVLNQTGGTSLPTNSQKGTWDIEESLDVEWAHSIAPDANIILFEASSNSDANLFTAVKTAADYANVSVVSMSWGGSEFSSETSDDSDFVTPSGHQGVTFLAATGDSGTPSEYPAFSPNVVAVGGTSLDINSSGTYLSESAWDDQYGAGGGGISEYEAQPSYQVGKVNGTSSTKRTVPDVSMDADPTTGVYVLDSYDGGYFQVGGTSLATPMWAGLVAIADQGRALDGQSSLTSAQTLSTLYDLPSSDFHDITTGSNGTYDATVGYDLATGIGTPVANLLVPGLAGYTATASTPPSVSAPSSASVNENSTLVFSTAQGDAITLSDAEIGANTDTLTLNVSDGSLALGSTSGLTSVSGNDSPSITLAGNLASLNGALNGLVYTPTTDSTASDTLKISLTDSGDSLTGTGAVSITVNPVNSPVIAAPSTIDVNQDSTLVFSSSGNDAITLSDTQATSTTVETLTLSVSDGSLALGSTSGLASVSGNDSPSITATGTLANLNTALNGLVYTPVGTYTGNDSLAMSLTDPGSNLTGKWTVAIVVNPQTPPSITGPTAIDVNEDSTLVFSTTNGDAFTLADAAAGPSTVDTLTLNVNTGSLALGTTSELVSVSGNNSSSITATGTLANLTAALNGLTYTPVSGTSGSASLVLTLANSGDGLQGKSTVAITINAFTPPTISLPSAISVTENSALVFSTAKGTAITLTDSFAGSIPETLTLSATDGILTLETTSGLTFDQNTTNGSSSIVVTGTLAELNAAVNGLTYTPGSNFVGTDTLKLSLLDTGTNLTGTGSSAITVNSLTQPPTVTAPATESVSENSSLTFSTAKDDAIDGTDPEAGAATEEIVLTATHGTLKLATTSGLKIVSGANKSASMTVSGTLANLNAALNGLIFTPTSRYVGTATISVSLKDSGDGLSGSATVDVTVSETGGRAVVEAATTPPVNAGTETPPQTQQSGTQQQGSSGSKETVLTVNVTNDGITVDDAATEKNGVPTTPAAAPDPALPPTDGNGTGNPAADNGVLLDGSTSTSGESAGQKSADSQDGSLFDDALQWLGFSAAVEILNS
jgi:hypothetical protein